ncbi:MAG: polysaccharide deacetylase family protein [Sulfobacillus sp.]
MTRTFRLAEGALLMALLALSACGSTAPSARAKVAAKTPSAVAAKQPTAATASAAGKPTYVGGQGGVYYQNMVVVLTWHAIAQTGVYDTISVSAFQGQMAALAADGFHPISAAQFSAFLLSSQAIPDNAVLLTFDNGVEDVYTLGFPILQHFHFPSVMFPVLGRTNVLSGYFTSAQITALAKSGLVTIGSHTYAQHTGVAVGPHQAAPADVMPAWNGVSTESAAQFQSSIANDAALAQAAIIKWTGRAEPYFSDPFGQYTPTLIAALAKAGFTQDFTTLGWAVVPGAPADRIPRINVGTGSSSAASMIGAILQVARLTAADPTWHPPLSHVVIWHT